MPPCTDGLLDGVEESLQATERCSLRQDVQGGPAALLALDAHQQLLHTSTRLLCALLEEW